MCVGGGLCTQCARCAHFPPRLARIQLNSAEAHAAAAAAHRRRREAFAAERAVLVAANARLGAQLAALREAIAADKRAVPASSSSSSSTEAAQPAEGMGPNGAPVDGEDNGKDDDEDNGEAFVWPGRSTLSRAEARVVATGKAVPPPPSALDLALPTFEEVEPFDETPRTCALVTLPLNFARMSGLQIHPWAIDYHAAPCLALFVRCSARSSCSPPSRRRVSTRQRVASLATPRPRARAQRPR